LAGAQRTDTSFIFRTTYKQQSLDHKQQK